jgi:hypothetical protein
LTKNLIPMSDSFLKPKRAAVIAVYIVLGIALLTVF